LDKRIRGYHVITGRVERIGESRTSIWINLTGKVALRIKREDLIYFNESELQDLKGKMIQVRGWIYNRDKELRINLKHGSDMMLIPKLPGNAGFSKTRSNYIQGVKPQD
jgi:hypothetical protein